LVLTNNHPLIIRLLALKSYLPGKAKTRMVLPTLVSMNIV
jgi:hypothetical protein